MSEFQELGLSISVSDPLVKTDRAALTTSLTSKIKSYSHEFRRIGGWYSANIEMTDNEERTNDWIQNGIGKHIEVDNPDLVRIFEGFVNALSIKTGEDTIEIGPLVEIGNDYSVIYSTIDTSVAPPVFGDRQQTASATDTTSIALYGTWEKIESIDGAIAADAQQIRDTAINDPTKVYPATSGEIALSGGGDFDISIEILGYWHYLKAYYYANAAATGTATVTAKIQAVLGADTNGIFSTDYSQIATNASTYPAYSSGEELAETILLDINELGDASNNSYSMGVYAGRRFIYQPIPTTIKYQKRRGEAIMDLLGGRIKPWDVLPAEWIFRPDFLVGRNPPITSATLGTDPRAGLIEVVKYKTPWDLSINGVKLSEVDRLLARRGVGA